MPSVYGTPDGFREYFDDRGREVPSDAIDDVTVNQWLLVASEAIDGSYQPLFPGLKVGLRAQIREWPRNSAFDIYGYTIDNTIVPDEVTNATYEAAILIAANPSAFNASYAPSKYDSVQIDGAINVKYTKGVSAAEMQIQYPIIAQTLSPVLNSRNSVSSLSGEACRV